MRTQFSKFAFTAALMLAITFTFSCSSDDGDGDGNNAEFSSSSSSSMRSSSSNGSSSSIGSSSSSLASSSSSVAVFSSSSMPSSSSVAASSSNSIQAGIIYGTPVTYEGETYETVVIGTQTWFQRNLNYAVEGSKCGNNGELLGYLSDTNTTTCITYGRLYNWATAMNLPSNCNSSSCAGQISANHKGICPTGWHIPSDADWDKLVCYVDGTSSPCDSYTAGKYLKATSGWNDNGENSGNGTDDFGFAALPGGVGLVSSIAASFNGVGVGGIWWSASEYSAGGAYNWGMYYNNEYVNWKYNSKGVYLFSVRCLQD